MAACAVGNGHAIHAMVLDCVKEENTNHGKKLFFLFKNTYNNDKQVKVQIATEFNIFILILNISTSKPIIYIYIYDIFYKTNNLNLKKMLEMQR